MIKSRLKKRLQTMIGKKTCPIVEFWGRCIILKPIQSMSHHSHFKSCLWVVKSATRRYYNQNRLPYIYKQMRVKTQIQKRKFSKIFARNVKCKQVTFLLRKVCHICFAKNVTMCEGKWTVGIYFQSNAKIELTSWVIWIRWIDLCNFIQW